jgi:hypothetical protein
VKLLNYLLINHLRLQNKVINLEEFMGSFRARSSWWELGVRVGHRAIEQGRSVFKIYTLSQEREILNMPGN